MKVRFVHLRGHVDVTVSMAAPKKVEDRDAWLKAAQKACPQIPQVRPPSPWQVVKCQATLNMVVFELDNRKDKHTKEYDFCHVVINRTASSLG